MLLKHISQYSDEELGAKIQQLVDDKTPESMTVEYKSEEAFSERFKLEIAKDISSFANTKGGLVVYGIPEEHASTGTEELSIPSKQYGTQPIPNFVSRLENILIDTISPHLPDLWIREVPVLQKPSLRVYVVWHPESWLMPHMVQGYNEARFYKRGLLRTYKMAEHEVRDAYIRVQRNIEVIEQFLNSAEIQYATELFPSGKSLSQAIICPRLLVVDRVDYAGSEMREWLKENLFPQEKLLPDGSTVSWYPSLHGAQIGMKAGFWLSPPERLKMYFWVELHRNGAINFLWQTRVSKRNDSLHLFWRDELKILKDFLNFSKDFYSGIRYYAPLHFRFSINNLAGVELKPGETSEPLAAQLPCNTFRADLVEDAAKLVENPTDLLQSFADRLFQAYGLWEAPIFNAPG